MKGMTRTGFAFSLLLLSLLFQETAHSQSVAFETIAKGETSYFRYGETHFLGGDLVIRDDKTWAWFWTEHTHPGPLLIPPLPLPEVDFAKEMVLVTLLGHQTSGGGPAIDMNSIEWISETGSVKKGISVIVRENRKPGFLTVITNPFHIIKVKKHASVIFQHEPAEKTCIGNTECGEKEFCDKAIGDCEGAGICEAKPQACLEIYSPVCGCDGKTYGNACAAATAGVSIFAAEACSIEEGYVHSGGMVTTGLCCQSAGDFPSTCAIGPCGCPPASSHEVKVCDCGPGKCFDGQTCVPLL